MSFCETAEKIYLPTWRNVLVDWLGWDEQRFLQFVEGWRVQLSDENNIFFHDNEWRHIIHLLVPDNLRDELLNQGHESTLAFLRELDVAIRGLPLAYPISEPDFDWSAAKNRANEFLQRYGHSLPGPDTVTDYETQTARRGQTT